MGARFVGARFVVCRSWRSNCDELDNEFWELFALRGGLVSFDKLEEEADRESGSLKRDLFSLGGGGEDSTGSGNL